MRRELRGRVILLTGASRGIGRYTAERLAQRGAKLALAARSREELETLAQQLRQTGAEAIALPTDLTDAEQRRNLVHATVAHFGALDVLVNNAGVASFGEFATSTPEVLRKIVELNFYAAVEMIREALPHLKQSATRHRGAFRPAILNVASICGRRGIPSFPEHCGSKFAIVGFSEAIRNELAIEGIDVLVVLPGLVRADDLEKHMLRNEGRIALDFQGAQPPDEVAEVIVQALIRNRKEVTAGRVAWWLHLGQRLAPRVMNWAMAYKVRKYDEMHPLPRSLGGNVGK